MKGSPYIRLLLSTSMVVLAALSQPSFAQTGCPGCSISLPSLPADTIYLGDAPDGVAGQYYDGDISFRMPKTTTPVNASDPSTPAGLNISEIKIIAVVNLPPGLNWTPSQTSFDPSNETDGCVKLCGVPLQPGLYEVEVFVTATVLLIEQSTSFTFPIYIAPAGSVTDGFSMQNSSGCGSVAVDFVNNVPSSGQAGYSYTWDFGNGQSSISENPGTQVYSLPGMYPVSYQAVIDTFGYQLTNIQVLTVGCSDVALPPLFNGNPDLYLRVKNPQGTTLLTTAVVDNTPLPFSFSINLPLGDGDYQIEVRDDDTFGDEGCGSVSFNKSTSGVLVYGDLQLNANIIHPVTTVQSVDTVVVFPQPDAPVVMPNGQLEICDGEAIELTANYPVGLQWFQDSVLLFGETDSSLVADSEGAFWVEYTSAEGCKAVSDPVSVAYLDLPGNPVFQVTGNEMTVANPDLLPDSYTLQWYQDGVAIPGANNETYCLMEAGVYLFTLEVVDNLTGCSNDFSLGVAFNPAYTCASATGELSEVANSFALLPNPAGDLVTVQFELTEWRSGQILCFDSVGRLVKTGSFEGIGQQKQAWDLSGMPSGLYWVRLETEAGSFTKKLVKAN